ncbi:MAG: hypothetical protein LBH73_09150 [Spirochaetaceae bacterium]|jgi:hypothetical protein|nr:hypothetical protein [Spirochaetaceae bacterium]
MMKRKTMLAVLVIFSCFSLAAQEAPRAVLSDTWVNTLTSNWEAINNGMNAIPQSDINNRLEAALMEFVERMTECLYPDSVPDFAAYRASFQTLRKTRLPPEGEEVFIKYGLGPDCSEAFWVCMIGIMLLYMERDPDLQSVEAQRGPQMRQIIHPNDFAVLEKNFDQLIEYFGSM